MLGVCMWWLVWLGSEQTSQTSRARLKMCVSGPAFCSLASIFDLFPSTFHSIRITYSKCPTRPIFFAERTTDTYGTYFSCPSLEISSTSFSRRLSIAMSTANRDAILKQEAVATLQRMLCCKRKPMISRPQVIRPTCKTTWWTSRGTNNSCLCALRVFNVGGKLMFIAWERLFNLTL